MMSFFMGYEAAADLPLSKVEVETPFESLQCREINRDAITIVPILRAGMGMLDGVLNTFPFANVGHLGVFRDKKTKEAHQYFAKMPVNIENSDLFLLDPLLATGNTVIAALDVIKQYKPRKIRFLCILASKEGITKINQKHSDVDVYTLSVERELNKDAYLIPGVGDAGDRLFGTK